MRSPHNYLNKLDFFLIWFKKISDGGYVFGKWLLVSLMFSIVVLVLIDISFRYIINMSLIWPQEITKWCLVWVGYIGAGVALRTESHVAMTMLTNWIGNRARFGVLLSGKFIMLFFVVFFTWYGYKQAIFNPAYSWAVHIRYTYVMLGMPLAGALMLIHLLYLITRDIYAWFYEPSSESKHFAGITNP